MYISINNQAHRKAHIMGLETKALHQIEKAFNEVGADMPDMYWQYGTLWISTEDKNDLELVNKQCRKMFLIQNSQYSLAK